VTDEPGPCPCCTFGNHTEACTCDGAKCCHRERHVHGGLCDLIADAVRQVLAFEKADAVPVEVEARVLAIVGLLIRRKDDERMEQAIRAADAEEKIRRVRALLPEGKLISAADIRAALDGTAAADTEEPPA
jgi:hypothetical protein